MRGFSVLVLTATLLAGCEEAKKPAPITSASSATPVKSAPAPVASTSAVASAAPEPEPETIAAQHVLVAYRGAKNAPRTVKRSKSEAKKVAEEVLQKARAGEDFSALAERYSDDPTRTNRGSLGKFPKDRMVPEFAGPAFRLKEGEISDVVETAFGFHIIKRNQ